MHKARLALRRRAAVRSARGGLVHAGERRGQARLDDRRSAGLQGLRLRRRQRFAIAQMEERARGHARASRSPSTIPTRRPEAAGGTGYVQHPRERDIALAGAGNPASGQTPKGAVQSKTDFGKPGYGGPCPPKGDKPHRYIFTVYALKVDKLDADENAIPSAGRIHDQREPARQGELHRHLRPQVTHLSKSARRSRRAIGDRMRHPERAKRVEGSAARPERAKRAEGSNSASFKGGCNHASPTLSFALFASAFALAVQAQVPAGYPADYAKIVDGAKKEGKVVVYSTTDAKLVQPLIKDFEVAFPGVKVEYTDMNSTEVYSRFTSENAANAASADAVWSSAMDLQMKLAVRRFGRRVQIARVRRRSRTGRIGRTRCTRRPSSRSRSSTTSGW